jgi:hypothetical protein
MADQTEHSGSNSKRKKIIVAGLLALFLVVVIMRPKSSSPSSGSTSICDGYAPPASLTVPIANSNIAVEPSILPLPLVDLRLVLEHDPFRSHPDLESLAKSSEEASAAQSTVGTAETAVSLAVQTQIPQIEIPVSAIVTGGKRSAALIGQKLYYENDVLEDRWQIVAIKSNSILVKSAHN